MVIRHGSKRVSEQSGNLDEIVQTDGRNYNFIRRRTGWCGISPFIAAYFNDFAICNTITSEKVSDANKKRRRRLRIFQQFHCPYNHQKWCLVINSDQICVSLRHIQHFVVRSPNVVSGNTKLPPKNVKNATLVNCVENKNGNIFLQDGKITRRLNKLRAIVRIIVIVMRTLS